MNRSRILGPGVFLVVGTAWTASAASADDAHQPGELFPAQEWFDAGHLKVSDLHTIGYALYGNPKGKPIFVLHGGPGVGCYSRLMQYFNPEKFLIVLHDQRGAGRSTPAGEIRENTTQHLVEDIERLRKHLKIDGKILIFGGSWGSTLALAYAETYPERVSGMVIRGIWTGTQAELDHYYGEQGIRKFFPDAWARLEAELPPRVREFQPKSLLELFSKGDAAIVRKVGDAWIRYAVKTGNLHAPDEKVEQGWGDYDGKPGAIIDTYYASNGFFLEEGQLLRDAHKIRDIAVTIINGRYDVICPPITAWRLHKALPKSKLIIVEEAGHSEGEPGTTRALVEAVAEFE